MFTGLGAFLHDGHLFSRALEFRRELGTQFRQLPASGV